MALCQNSPDLRTQAKSVRQHLKNDVPLRWPEPVVPERRQAQYVSGAVGEIESAVQRVLVVLRVLQPRQARTDETSELLRVWMRLLTALGQDVKITVKSKPQGRERARIRVVSL